MSASLVHPNGGHTTTPSNPRRKTAPGPASTSNREVSRKVEDLSTKVVELGNQQDNLFFVIQRAEGKMDKVLKLLGEEEEDGAGGIRGTGLFGRMGRTEKAVEKMTLTFRLWLAFGSGFALCVGTSWAIVWWLTGDKIAELFK